MRTVWKYTLDPRTSANSAQVIEVPRNAVFLAASKAPSEYAGSTAIDVHVEVETNEPTERRLVVLMETGKELPSGQLEYLGTVRLLTDAYVIHVYFDPKLGGRQSPALERSLFVKEAGL